MVSLAMRNRLVLLLVCVLCMSTASGQFGGGGGDFGGVEDNMTYMDTSLAVVGDASTVPLDSASLNGLFTSTFRARMANELKELGKDTTYDLSPASIQLFGLNSDGEGDRARVARLIVGYKDPPEEILDELSVAAPKAALELLRESVHDYLRMQQDLQRENVRRQWEGLKERQQELEQLLREKQAKLLDLRAGAIESSGTLREHYLRLKQQQRDDRMALLNTEARRDAIVEQIDRLRQRARERGPEEGEELLDAMKMAFEDRNEKLEELKRNAGEKNEAIKNLERAIAETQEEMEATQRKSLGERDKNAIHRELHQQLVALKHELDSRHAELANRVARAEQEAMQGRIEYLRHLEQQRQSEYGSRLEKLNEMLTDVAVASDEVEGRQDAVARELSNTEAKIVDRMKSDLNLERVEREVDLLENQLRSVEQQLFHLDLKEDAPPQQEFAILPWGG